MRGSTSAAAPARIAIHSHTDLSAEGKDQQEKQWPGTFRLTAGEGVRHGEVGTFDDGMWLDLK